MNPADHAARARSFGSAADQYDRFRPTYPEEAVRWVAGEQPARVVDLGAGTGILSRALTALGHEVIPVEPDEEMRARLAAVSPDLTPLAGSAEAIPLPDASVDVVVAGQAYHWFDPKRAHTEVARVLRPEGRFAVVWNVRDQSVDWAARLSAIAEGVAPGAPVKMPLIASFGPLFGPVQGLQLSHTVDHTPETLLGLVKTRSYYLTASTQQQRAIEEQVRELCTTHPELAGRDTFPLPYQTRCYRATRLAD
jgi:SAM-dependent methyltransferase